MEDYINAISRAGPYISQVLDGFLDGFEDLVRGELCLYRGELNDAEQYLKRATIKARESDQYVTQNRALVYLMAIDIFRGDLVSASAKLKEMEALLSEKDYGVRYTMYDVARGFYNHALDQNEQMPEWLKGNFSPFSHPAFLENYANRARARYHYQTRNYKTLLAFIKKATEFPAILLDKIELKVLQALSLYQLKQRDAAIAALVEAYRLAEPNKIIIPFSQLAKDMRALSAAALKDCVFNADAAHDKTCPIPKDWLEDINRVSSTYAKRRAKMISEYRMINNCNGEIKLTKQETTILKDLSKGLSRPEIASSRKISIKTVKRITITIYNKLYVTSLPEAIRVAMDRKII